MSNSVSESHTLDQVIGANLRLIREKRQLGVTAFAAQMRDYIGQGWSRQEVYRYEKGTRPMSAQELVAAAMVLESTVAQLTASTGRVEIGARSVGGHELTDALSRTSAEVEGWQRYEVAAAALSEMRSAALRYVDAISYVRSRAHVSPALKKRIREDMTDSLRRLREELTEVDWPKEWGDMSSREAVAANATPSMLAASDTLGDGQGYEALAWAWSVRREGPR